MSRHDDAHGAEDLRSATRAFTEAVNLFTRAVGDGAQEAGRGVSSQISEALRTASRELADASGTVARATDATASRSRAERTREELVAAARRVFAAKGYEGASVGDIAAEAGFTKGALYANFGSKQALFLEVADRVAEHSAASLAAGGSAASPESAQSIEDALLVLETWTFAMRHAEARAQIAGCWRAAMDTAVPRRAAGQAGPGPEQTGSGRESVAAMDSLITRSLASILTAVLAAEPEQSVREPPADAPES
ncbi:MAG: helix-turn-helix domain-containing protein [Propionibacterium sp.]